jgi:hypothetical protein
LQDVFDLHRLVEPDRHGGFIRGHCGTRERAFVGASNEQRHRWKKLRPMLQNETRRRGAHRDRQVEAALAEQRVEVVEQRALVRRLPGTSKLMGGFVEIDRVRRFIDQQLAEARRDFVPRRKVRAKGVQQQHLAGLGHCALQRGQQQYPRQPSPAEPHYTSPHASASRTVR